MVGDQDKASVSWINNSKSCEANPKPLSEYITALVRKEKTVEELTEICNDQLKVFLQDKTTDFVKELFQVIADKSYMTPENMGRNQSPNQARQDDGMLWRIFFFSFGIVR